MNRPLLVTAWLASPLAGEPPKLDAILEWSLSIYYLDKASKVQAQEPWKIRRDLPAPKPGEIPIPLARVQVGPWLVPCCSDPILPVPLAETVEHVTKRLAVEEAGLLRPEDRRIVSTTNSWTKSYRLPLRIRSVSCIRWFARGNRRNLLKALDQRAVSLGKKRSDGYGRVQSWEAQEIAQDLSWYAPHVNGTVLMRTLPLLDGSDHEWLPRDLLGWKKDYGACSSPYWHPERYCDIVTPV